MKNISTEGKAMKTKYKKSDFNRLWTWKDSYCQKFLDGLRVGQRLVIPEFLQTVQNGQIILVGEFDGAKRARQMHPNGCNIDDCMTGRQWVLKCIREPKSEIVDYYGMPMVKKHGTAQFKLMEIVEIEG